jgi:molybdopterin-guanine dinucleotide biosynthesis protein B
MTKRFEEGRIIGVVGWKNSGKTTLVERLVVEFVRRGWRVATVKHAHHDAVIDDGDTDSARHRRAGASEVALVTSARWALLHELREEPEPALDEVLARLSPADLVLVEGYKRAAVPKIEVRRAGQASREPLAAHDPYVIAIAADHVIDDATVPTFALDDIAAIAEFIVARLEKAS